MPLSLYEASIPVFIRNLQILQALLAKGQAHSAVSGATLKELRLVSDMLPLTFQVQSVCNLAKYQAVRVGGVENVAMKDIEETFQELADRIVKTIAFLESVEPDSMDGKEEEIIDKTVKRHGAGVQLNGTQYTFEYSLTNFFFHLTMVYAILRKEGVDIGKLDYLGSDL